MVLDDTIKFLSKIEDQDEEEEEEGDEEEDNEDVENDDDEETKRKFEIQERENILMNCLEYKDDILKYMRQLELENRPKVNYMKKQLDITSSMRSILVDWLVEVCDEYKLNVETLYLAVNYTDRFLSQMSVLRGKLQLVGTASMYIASKYEEITPPDVAEFVYITDDTYTKKQVLRMEHLMLKVLDFRMSPPTANWFLSHYLRFIKLQTSLNHANNFDLYQRIDHLSRYLAELTLIDSETFLAYLPSQIAVSAIYLALYTLGRAWTRQIAEICGYSYDLSEIKACINDLFKAMQAAETHPQQAIQEKYKQSRYDYVALTEPPKALPSFLTQ
jgi:cyclin A